MTKKKKTNKQDEKEKAMAAEQIKSEKGSENNETNEQDENAEATSCEDDKENLETQLAELKDKHLRLFSEFDNYRKRTTKERLDLFKTANADLLIDLLPVLDDFDRALQSFEKTEDVKAIKEGVELIQSKFKSTLEKKGLTCMDSIHKEFDTDYHEALTEIPAPSEELKSKVVDVIEKGYLLNDKVIRYAKVVVGK